MTMRILRRKDLRVCSQNTWSSFSTSSSGFFWLDGCTGSGTVSGLRAWGWSGAVLVLASVFVRVLRFVSGLFAELLLLLFLLILVITEAG